MRRFHRVALLALLIGAAPAITGCTDFDLDKLDVFGLNQKKPLPGERQALFPGGVPGVTQGVPPELMMGNQQAQMQTGAAIPIEGVKPEGESKTAEAKPEEKPKPKPKPKKVAQSSKPTRIKMVPQEQPDAAQPASASAPAAQPTSASQPWPAPGQSASPWPAPPQSGTFSKQQ